MKKFFKKTEGFTLVELIVVIAILGILAGVGTVAYSGYIKKANEAADKTLLATINQAFTAACIENGVNQQDLGINGAKVEMTDKKVTGVTDVTHAKSAAVEDAFDKYYAGNTGNAFKTISDASEIQYNPAYGFYSANLLNGAVVADYYGVSIFLAPADVAALNNSVFMDESKGLGIQGTMDKVLGVANFAMGAGEDVFNAVLEDPAYQKTLAGYMGISTAGKTEEQIAEALDAKVAEMVIAKVGADATEEQQNAAVTEIATNMAILYATTNTAGTSKTDVMNLLTAENPKSAIAGAMSGADKGAGLGQAAVAYGMYTAYVHSTGGTVSDDAIEVMNGLKDEGFQAYLATDAAQKDMDGFLAALNMANSSTQDPDAVSKLLTNGFDDPALITMLQGALAQ